AARRGRLPPASSGRPRRCALPERAPRPHRTGKAGASSRWRRLTAKVASRQHAQHGPPTLFAQPAHARVTLEPLALAERGNLRPPVPQARRQSRRRDQQGVGGIRRTVIGWVQIGSKAVSVAKAFSIRLSLSY